MLTLDLSHAFLKEDFHDYREDVAKLDETLRNKTCKGSDFTGWMTWANDYDKEEFARIKKAAEKIRNESDVLVVCGIGGSYLGARAAIEMINGLYPAKQIEVIYMGNTFSSTYIAQVMEYLKDREVSVKCHFQIWYNHRNRSGFPDPQTVHGRQIRGPGRRPHLCHHRQGSRCPETHG